MIGRLRDRVRSDDGVTLIELLVVMLLMGVVATAIMNVVLSMNRTQQYTLSHQQVMDDGRVSIDRIRKELRQARLVYAAFTCGADETATCTTSSKMHFWVDADQDSLQQTTEQVFYCIQNLNDYGYGGKCVTPSSGRYALARWTKAGEDNGVPPQVLAKTLVNATDPFTFNVSPRETRLVIVHLDFHTGTDRGPDSFEMDATVRLRNVA